MASRSISAILWTLVSINVITLVVGGLITWLGYAIPVRLKQFGLLPELVIVAGFASLIVACIGLCALNYSSHHALNIYGFSCMVFIMMLVFGIPETWYKSHQFGDGSLLLDIIYFSLLVMLIILLVFSFTLAQHLRRKELAQNQEDGNCSSPNCSCNVQHFQSMGESQDQPQDRNNRNTSSSIIDKWLPWTNNNSNNHHHHHHGNRNNLDEINLASRNNCCHSSNNNNSNNNCQSAQVQAQTANQFAVGSRCNVCNNNNNYHKPILGLMGAQPTNSNPYHPPLAPLVHKGFYQSSSSGSGLVRAKSFNQPLDEQLDDVYDKTHQSQMRAYDCRWMNRIYRSSSSNQCLTQVGPRDDSLLHYGQGHILTQFKQHYQMPMSSTLNRNHHRHHHYHNHNLSHAVAQPNRSPYNVPKCNCLLGSGQNITTSLDYRKYFNNDLASNTMPRLNTSTYATKLKPKIRAKGSSSVVAMTAAAAAALLGGVADTCSTRMDENDGIFVESGDGIGGVEGGGDADVSLLDRCLLDNNHQLNVSMLNDTSSNVHQSACRQPVLDFTSTMEFRKS